MERAADLSAHSLFRDIQCHRLALLRDVADCANPRITIHERSSAEPASPTNAAGGVETARIKRAAAVGLEPVDNARRRFTRIDNGMQVVGANVSGRQVAAAMLANVADGLQH